MGTGMLRACVRRSVAAATIEEVTMHTQDLAPRAVPTAL
jgi:hypothetical protein